MSTIGHAEASSRTPDRVDWTPRWSTTWSPEQVEQVKARWNQDRPDAAPPGASLAGTTLIDE